MEITSIGTPSQGMEITIRLDADDDPHGRLEHPHFDFTRKLSAVLPLYAGLPTPADRQAAADRIDYAAAFLDTATEALERTVADTRDRHRFSLGDLAALLRKPRSTVQSILKRQTRPTD